MNHCVALALAAFALVFGHPAVVGAAPPGTERKLELVVQTGHTMPVTSANFSPDGRWVVTTSLDKTAIIWDVATGEKLRTLAGHRTLVTSAAVSADGTKVLTASPNDKAAIIWDAETGKVLHTLKHDSEVVAGSFSPDGKSAVTAGEAATIWDVGTGRLVRTLQGRTGDLGSVRFSPDGTRVVAASDDKTVIIWDAGTGKQQLTLKGHTSEVSSACFSPDGRRVVSASVDKTAIVWDAASGKATHTLAGHTGEVVSASFSADGRRVVTGSFDKTAIVWDADAGKHLLTLKGHTGHVLSGHFSPDGKRVVTASFDQSAIVWDAESGRALRTLSGDATWVLSADFRDRGRQVLTRLASTNGAFDGGTGGAKLVETMVAWDAEGGAKFVSEDDYVKDYSTHFHLEMFSPDGKRVVVSSENNTMTIWDFGARAKLHTLTGHKGAARTGAFSRDGKHVVTASEDKTAIVWDSATGKRLQTLEGHTGAVYTASFSGDGKRVVTASTDKTAIVWDATTGEKVRTLEGHADRVTSARFSGDGKLIVTTSDDNLAILWDAATGRRVRSLAGHTHWVHSGNFSPDGTRVLTASADGTARMWDTETGREPCSLTSFNEGKDWLAITPDGYFDGSENGARFVRLRITGTNELVPLERYRKHFERPGLLDKVWSGADYRGNRAVKLDLPLRVRITAPAAGLESKDGKLVVEAEAVSRGDYPVEQFRLLVNGRPHGAKLGLVEVTDPQEGKTTARWEIDLEPGRHTIEVLAYTKAVFARSEAVEVKYVGGGAAIDLPTLYILAIGVSQYPKQPLDFAHRDAEEVARAFQQNGKALFKKVEVKVLTDEKATRDNILEGLEWLRRSMTQKDFGVFFFAGHGVKDERDKVFFLPVDGDREKLTRTAIDGNVLAEELTSTVGQLVVILDACHAGAVDGNKKRGLSENLLKDLSSEEKGIAIMCSASGREEASESREHRHGAFTVALLEGLRGTGDGKESKIRLTDGAVYFKQLDGYVTDRVKVLTKGVQHPVTSTPRGFRDFPISKP